MSVIRVFRVQPAGMDLDNHRSETSIGELDCGVHVFFSLEELQGAVNGWVAQDYIPEIVVIECDRKDVIENRDYEGSVLVDNRGKIVHRIAFASWDTFESKCRDYAITTN